MKRHRLLPFGAESEKDGVRFRVWAPKAHDVAVAIEGGATVPLQRDTKGWFGAVTPAAQVGSLYRYVIDGAAVPDPASRHQPQDVHGPSEVTDPGDYDWRDGEWRGRPWEETILYELHVGSFSESGDFAGVVQHLDHLVRLGVTAVELLPVADFPGTRNWGYDGVLAFAPDASYGRPEELKRLVEQCHHRGLSVFLDVVYNHFGPDGNYLGMSAPNFFTDRHQTPWGAAINFDGDDAAPVRQFFVENALYWLEEFHFDGLRFDAVHAIIDDSDRHILTAIAEAVRQRFAGGRPVHLVLENDHNEAWPLGREGSRAPLYDAQWDDDLHHAFHVVATGDKSGYYADYAEAPMATLGRALAEGFAYQGDPSPYRDGDPRGEPSAHLPPTAFVSFLQNHDQVGNNAFGSRLSRLAEPELIRLVAAIYLLAPQIPMIFMGEEWGTERPFPFFCDFEPELAQKVREGRRREFARFPEFQDEAAQARIPDPCAAETFLGARLDWTETRTAPHESWLAFYRDLLALRTREIVPLLAAIAGNAGSYRVLGPAAMSVAWNVDGGRGLVLHANFGRVPVTLDAAPTGRRLYATASLDGRTLPPRSVAFLLDEVSAPP